MKRYLFLLVVIANTALGDSMTIGPRGINSKVTGLDGSLPFGFEVNIGQVEPFRSGKRGYDADAASAPNTFPFGVYVQSTGNTAGMNDYIDAHATEVAGVMIGKAMPDETYEGVAPEAKLHSMALFDTTDDSLVAVATQSIARLNVVPEVVAINLSFGREAFFFELDGRSLYAQFVDWSAREHDVLYVVTWPNNFNSFPSTASDNYNGITVGASTLDSEGETYEAFAGTNTFPNFLPGSERTYIDILAPGEYVDVYSLDEDGDGNSDTHIRFGTSYAAPHVTGAVALMHQFVAEQADAGNERFFGTFNHRAAKAVLMNSADKLAAVQGSSRDITNHIGQTWDQTEASISADIPLDPGMGAGHLNVERAIVQLRPGKYQWTTTDPVPRIGWAQDFVNPSDDREYVINMPIAGNNYASITLTWDRVVEHTGGGTYHYGDQFFNYADPYDRMGDLNLKLVAMTSGEVVAESTSTLFNVEHIFFKLTGTDSYKIVVEHVGGLQDPVSYGLAWWIGETPLLGDYNGNGSVGPEDYDLWQSSFGSTSNLDADGNGNDVIDAADYVVWRDNFDKVSGSAFGTAVPEPEAWVLLLIAAICCITARRPRLRVERCMAVVRRVS